MIGGLTERITFERRVRSADAAGGAAQTWVLVATVWARVEVLASGEISTADGRRALTRYTLSIRRRTDVDATMRALWRTKTLYLRGVKDAGPHQPYLTLSADDGDPL